MTALATFDLRQRYDALGRANEIRIRRCQMKRDLRNGAVQLEDVLREPEWFVFSMPICELLACVPRVGKARVNRVLRRAEVWPLREVGMLTLRQRERVLREKAAGWGR